MLGTFIISSVNPEAYFGCFLEFSTKTFFYLTHICIGISTVRT